MKEQKMYNILIFTDSLKLIKITIPLAATSPERAENQRIFACQGRGREEQGPKSNLFKVYLYDDHNKIS